MSMNMSSQAENDNSSLKRYEAVTTERLINHIQILGLYQICKSYIHYRVVTLCGQSRGWIASITINQ